MDLSVAGAQKVLRRATAAALATFACTARACRTAALEEASRRLAELHAPHPTGLDAVQALSLYIQQSEQGCSVATGYFASVFVRADGAIVQTRAPGQGGALTETLELPPGASVVSVSLRFTHALAVCADGSVLSWYPFLDEGELLEDVARVLGRAVASRAEALKPGVVGGLLAGVRVTSVTAGYDFSVAVTSGGAAFAWGLTKRGFGNHSGRLGVGQDAGEWVERPRRVGVDGVVAASAGLGHTLFMLRNGRVLSCGYGYGGRLGRGSEQSEWVPRVVEALEHVRVVHVSAGLNYSVFVAQSGAAFACGINYCRQLGLGEDAPNEVLEPRAVVAPGVVFVRAAAGVTSSVFLDAEGRVWACGGAQGYVGGALVAEVGAEVKTPQLVRGLSAHSVTDLVLSGDLDGREAALFQTADGTVLGAGYQGEDGGEPALRLPGLREEMDHNNEVGALEGAARVRLRTFAARHNPPA